MAMWKFNPDTGIPLTLNSIIVLYESLGLYRFTEFNPLHEIENGDIDILPRKT